MNETKRYSFVNYTSKPYIYYNGIKCEKAPFVSKYVRPYRSIVRSSEESFTPIPSVPLFPGRTPYQGMPSGNSTWVPSNMHSGMSSKWVPSEAPQWAPSERILTEAPQWVPSSVPSQRVPSEKVPSQRVPSQRVPSEVSHETFSAPPPQIKTSPQNLSLNGLWAYLARKDNLLSMIR